jgi:3'-5' exoribonuclease
VKRKPVREIEPGDEVDQVFHVREASSATTKHGKPYLRATLGDATGEVGAIQFDVDEKVLESFPKGGYSRVRAVAESYKGKVSLKIAQARAAEGTEADPADFVPTTDEDVKALKKELVKLVRSVRRPELASALRAFFDDAEFVERFTRAPGATSYHHACAGGLLEHTVWVARQADAVAGSNARLDRDLLVAGALLHDIGKMEELSGEAGFEKTDAGNLVGHVVLGALMFDERARGIEDLPEDTRLAFLHMLLSHHGQRDWGSPVLPATAEALALHHLDNLDARVSAADAAVRVAAAPGTRWTEYNKMLGVRVWRGAAAATPPSHGTAGGGG